MVGSSCRTFSEGSGWPLERVGGSGGGRKLGHQGRREMDRGCKVEWVATIAALGGEGGWWW